MAYQTGAASNPTQLLDALRVFAVANGWTELRWNANGAGYQLSLTKNGLYFHLGSAVNEALRSGYSAVTGIFLTSSAGFDSAQPWNNQPGTLRNTSGQIEACGLYEVGASNTYHLFAAVSPDMILLAAEISPGVFHHLAFGDLSKYGAYAGGAFVTGSFGSDAYTYSYTGFNDYVFGYPYDRRGGLPFNDYKGYGQSFVRGTVDAVDAWFSVCQNSPLTGKRAKATWEEGLGTPRNSLARYWWGHVPNTLNGVTPMIPFYVFVERPSGFFSPFGYTPHLRYLNITNYQPAEQFVIGTDQWAVFPAHSKNGKSGLHGYAVRVNG